MKGKLSRMWRSGIALMLVFCMLMSMAPAAFAVDGGQATIKYVSLGDSITNGDGLNNRNLSYPNQFAAWLLDEDYANAVEPSYLAKSAMRAEDLLFLLTFPVGNANAIAVAEAEEFNEAKWNAAFSAGDYYTWKNFTSADDFDTNAVAKQYQDAVAAADVLSLGIGNANFGDFLMDCMMSAVSEESLAWADVERAMNGLDASVKTELMAYYNDLLAQLSAEAGSEMAADLANAMVYTMIGFAMSYQGILDRVVGLNGDVEMIIVPLVNTMDGIVITYEGETYDIGSYMDDGLKVLNAYLAALPAALQAAGEYPNAVFYYAKLNEAVELHANVGSNLTRAAIMDTVVGENGDGMLWSMLAEEVGAIYDGAKLLAITEDDVAEYEAKSDEVRAKDVAKFDDEGNLDMSGINMAISVSLYLALEEAILASKDETLSVEALEGLGNLETILADVMVEFADELEAEGKQYEDTVYEAVADLANAELSKQVEDLVGVKYEAKLTPADIEIMVLGGDACDELVYDLAFDIAAGVANDLIKTEYGLELENKLTPADIEALYKGDQAKLDELTYQIVEKMAKEKVEQDYQGDENKEIRDYVEKYLNVALIEELYKGAYDAAYDIKAKACEMVAEEVNELLQLKDEEKLTPAQIYDLTKSRDDADYDEALLEKLSIEAAYVAAAEQAGMTVEEFKEALEASTDETYELIAEKVSETIAEEYPDYAGQELLTAADVKELYESKDLPTYDAIVEAKAYSLAAKVSGESVEDIKALINAEVGSDKIYQLIADELNKELEPGEEAIDWEDIKKLDKATTDAEIYELIAEQLDGDPAFDDYNVDAAFLAKLAAAKEEDGSIYELIADELEGDPAFDDYNVDAAFLKKLAEAKTDDQFYALIADKMAGDSAFDDYNVDAAFLTKLAAAKTDDQFYALIADKMAGDSAFDGYNVDAAFLAKLANAVADDDFYALIAEESGKDLQSIKDLAAAKTTADYYALIAKETGEDIADITKLAEATTDAKRYELIAEEGGEDVNDLIKLAEATTDAKRYALIAEEDGKDANDLIKLAAATTAEDYYALIAEESGENVGDLIELANTNPFEKIAEELTTETGVEVTAAEVEARYDNGNGEAEIVDAVDEIKDAQAELANGVAELKDAQVDLADGLQEIKNAQVDLADGLQEIKNAQVDLADGLQEIKEAQADLADGIIELKDAQDELKQGVADMKSAQTKLADGLVEIKNAQTKLADGLVEIKNAQSKLTNGLVEIKDAQKTLLNGIADLKDAQTKLADGVEQLNDLKKQLTDGLKQVQDLQASAKQNITDLISSLNELVKMTGEVFKAQAEFDTELQKELENVKKEVYDLITSNVNEIVTLLTDVQTQLKKEVPSAQEEIKTTVKDAVDQIVNTLNDTVIPLLQDSTGYLCQLLAITEALSDTLTGNELIMDVLSLVARCVIGDGIGMLPTVNGHNTLAKAVEEAYKNKYTVQDETEVNVELALDALLKLLDENGLLIIDEAMIKAGLEGAYGAIEDLEAAAEALMVALENKIYEYETNLIPAIKNDLIALEILLGQLEARLAELEKQLADLEKQLAEIEEMPDAALSTVEELKQAIAETKALIAATKNDIAQVNDLIVSLETQLDEITETLKELKTAVNQMDAAIGSLYSAFKNQNISVEEALNNMKAARENAIAAVEAVEKLYYQLKDAAEDVLLMVELLQDEVVAVAAVFAAGVYAIYSILPESVQDYIVAEAEARIAALEAEIAQKLEEKAQATNDALKAQIQKQIDTLEAEIEEIRTQTERNIYDLGINPDVIDIIEYCLGDTAEVLYREYLDITDVFLKDVTDRNALLDVSVQSIKDLAAFADEEIEKVIDDAHKIYVDVTTTTYVVDNDSFYIALGDESADSPSYVDKLAADPQLSLEDAYENHADNRTIDQMLGDILDGDVPEIEQSDLITIRFDNSQIIKNAFVYALTYLKGFEVYELDWEKLLGKKGVEDVEAFLADLEAELEAVGLEEMKLMPGLPGQGRTLDKGLVHMAEAYLYYSIQYLYSLPDYVAEIREMNPDAVIIFVGMSNPFGNSVLKHEGVNIEIGGYVQTIVEYVDMISVAFCMLFPNATYVSAMDVETDAANVDLDLMSFFTDYITNQYSTLHPTDAGHTYIKEQILKSLTIIDETTCEHNYTAVVTAPTCTEAGYTTYTCSECGDSYIADEVDALGHTEGAVVVENENPASCTADGSYDSVVYCDVCGIELSRKNVTVSATGHNYVPTVTPPTCTEKGYTAYVCDECGYSYTADEVDALGHDYVVDFVWSTDGQSCEVTVTCGNCSDVNEVKAADVTVAEEKAATEDESGYIRYTATVVVDGVTYTETYEVVIPATGHTFEAPVFTWDDAYNCKVTQKCSGCGEVEELNATKTTVVTKEATCEEDGEKVHTVLVNIDGVEYSDTKTEVVPATGHNYETEFVWSADGKTCDVVVTCCDCDATETKAATVVEDTTKREDATHEKDGKAVYTATVVIDGVEYTDTKEVVIPATGHNYTAEYIWSADGQTCEVKLTCDCGATETKPATVVEDTTKRKEATCEEDGLEVYTATVVIDGVEYTDTKEVVIPATGHADNNGDGKCDECGKNMKLWGDADSNGRVNTNDSNLVLQYALRMIDSTQLDLSVCDVDANGRVNTNDANLILQHALRIITQFPVEMLP